MHNQETNVPFKIQEALCCLKQSTVIIDSIKQDARTPEVDTLIREAADSIFEAQEYLNKIDLEQYRKRSGGFIGENIRVFRHRKNKLSN